MSDWTKADTQLTIIRMPDGGYVVCHRGNFSELASDRFASTSIDEALKYIRGKLSPPAPVMVPDGHKTGPGEWNRFVP